MKLVCDNSIITNQLGWKPHYSIEEGLQETIEFISKHIDLYKPEQYTI
jgi:nucleoside-diphosphate-sugar epimerase